MQAQGRAGMKLTGANMPRNRMSPVQMGFLTDDGGVCFRKLCP